MNGSKQSLIPIWFLIWRKIGSSTNDCSTLQKCIIQTNCFSNIFSNILHCLKEVFKPNRIADKGMINEWVTLKFYFNMMVDLKENVIKDTIIDKYIISEWWKLSFYSNISFNSQERLWPDGVTEECKPDVLLRQGLFWICCSIINKPLVVT